MNLPDYELLSFIGRGGYGDVWLARDAEGRHWAVKIVYRSSFDDDRPYEREYNGIVRFHPVSGQSESQMRVIHVGRRDETGCFYYIMELADDASGSESIRAETYMPHTLRSELKARRRIPASEVSGLAWGLVSALENLHVNGLVHRDIKPGNIIFVGGRPKLADVGLVTDADLTRTYAGTEGYIPPEGPGTFRADIFSLGMTLYEASTGCDRRHFPALPENVAELPDHAQLLRLIRIINRACQPDRKRRYQTATEMRKDLETLLQGSSVAKPWTGWRIGFGFAAALVLLAVGGMGWNRWQGEREISDSGSNPVSETSSPSGEAGKAATPEVPTASTNLVQDEIPVPEVLDHVVSHVPASEYWKGSPATEEIEGRVPQIRRSRAVSISPVVPPNPYEQTVDRLRADLERARSGLDKAAALKNSLSAAYVKAKRKATKAQRAAEYRVAEAAWERQMRVVNRLNTQYAAAVAQRDLMLRPLK